MISRALLRLVCAAGLVGLASAAASGQTITLFGKQYEVRRFDYSQSVLMPNIAFPSDPPIPLFEAEGVHYVGGNRLIMSADDIADIAIGNPDNWFVEVSVLTSGCRVTGIAYSRTVATVDAATDGYDPNPSGVTVNSGLTGLSAEGNLVVCGGAGRLYGFSLAPATFGQPIEFPQSSGCLAIPGTCGIDISGSNQNAEDVAYVPGDGARPDQFFVINQDLVGLDGAGIERWSSTGTLLGSFVVGGAVEPGLNGGVAKGVVYLPDSPNLPASIRRPEGIVLISFDRNFPALQAFDLNGNLLATEYLTVSGTPAPPFRLDMSGCSQRMHIESIAADPATGRLFLVNQGSFLTCNYMWVLTPTRCVGDFNNAGGTTVQDIFDFLNAYFTADPAADVNCSGSVTVQDIFDFLNAYFEGCD
ncbi:MAG: GC-type dockerin domain-anchored protein [Phycisphaerales bacterium]